MGSPHISKLELFPRAADTIERVAADLRAGNRPCAQVLEMCLAQIDAWEDKVRAWVLVDREGAWRQAAGLDAEIAAGKYRGPLHGIPVGIKDIVDVAGFPTAAGSAERAKHVAKCDAPIVTRLRAAGAVILGKTVTTQFASFDPPITRNPWNLDRTPGGSSSGSAAAVATGMCLAAVGSQTGGSITRPASYCGAMGCKPSFGRVNLEGIVPLAENMDHPGPLARSVRGLAAMLDALIEAERAGSSLLAMCNSPQPPRIGRLHGLFDSRAEPAACEALDKVLTKLAAVGAHVSDAPLPAGFDHVLHDHRVVMAVEAAAWHERRLAEFPDDYLPRIRELLEEGLRTPAPEYARCRQFQNRLKREMPASFADVDVLACPATTGPAPDAATTGDPAMNSPWSFTGLPTICLPIALANDGLPLGIQLVGPPGGEAVLFRAAAWCEQIVAGATLGR